MTDQPLDPDLAARLRAAAGARITARVQAAKKRASAMADTRADFAQNRAAGLRSRHALRQARLDLTRHHQEKTMPSIDRDQIAQDTAEYIVNELLPKHADLLTKPGVSVHYSDERRPPTSIEDVKASLLEGTIWISWICDRVTQAMRQLHGQPTEQVAELVQD